MYPSYPSYPQFPRIPNLPPAPAELNFPANPPQVGRQTSDIATTFQTMLGTVTNDIAKPQELLEEMLGGKRKFDSTEVMLAILEAEKQLSLTVRVLNEITKGVKELERIQA